MAAGAKEVQVVLTFKDDGSYDIKKVLKDINTTLTQAGSTAKVTGTGFEKMGQQVKGAESGFDKLKSTFKSTMFQMAAGLGIWTGMSQAIGFVTHTIRDTIEQGKAFDEAFSKVRVVSKGTAEQNAALKESLLRMNPALGSATAMTKVLATTMREFKEYTRPEQLRFVEEAGRTAVAGFTDVETAADSLTTVIKGYKMELKDAAKIGETLVKATQLEGVSFEQVSRGLTKLSATANQVGVSFSELIGSYLTLQERQDPQMAMMQLRMLLTSLLKPSAAAQRAAKDIGVDWSIAGVKTMGWVNWLKKLNQATAGCAEVLDNIVPGGRNMVGMLELVGNNAKETQEKVDALTEAFEKGGVRADAFKERMHSMSFLMDTAKEIFTRFKIAIFEGFASPLMQGVTSSKDLEKRIQMLTNQVVDAGKKIGKAFYDMAQFVVKFGDAIKSVGLILGSLFAMNKFVGLTKTIITAIGGTSTAFAGLKFAIMAVAGALAWVAVGIAGLYAGYKVGELIGKIKLHGKSINEHIQGAWEKVLGVQKKSYELSVASAEMDKRRPELTSLHELNKLFKDTGVNVLDLKKKYGSFEAALDAVKEGTDSYLTSVLKERDARQKSNSEKIKAVTYEVALRSAMEGTLDMTDEGKKALEGLTEEQKNEIISRNHAREEMKKYGFTFKTELIERYAALKKGMELFKKDMTVDDYEKFRKILRGLGGDLGYVSKSLETLGVLTMEEADKEIQKQTKLYGDLNEQLKLGTISMFQYESGVKKIDEALKALDPTLGATWAGLTKLSETPIPGQGAHAGMFQAAMAQAPGVEAVPFGPQALMSVEEMRKALAKLGPSWALLTDLETKAGAPLKELAKRTLPDAERAFRSALAVGGLSAENLKIAADALIKHFKDAGEKVPADIASMGSDVTGTWQGVTQVMTDYWTQAMAEMVKSGINFRDVVNIGWQTLAVGAGKALGNMAEKALSSLRALAGPIGGLVSSLAGSLISGIGKLFGIKSKAEKAAEAAKRAEEEEKRRIAATVKTYAAFGKISDSTAKKILDMTKETNAATAAILTLNDVMGEAGVTIKNIGLYIQKMTKALYDIRLGSVDATKGVEAIGQSFTNLVNWAQRFGQEGSKSIVGFIQHLRKLGLNIKEIDDYVFAQLGSAVNGLKAMTASVGGKAYTDLVVYKDKMTELQTEVDDLSKSRLDTREAQLDYQRKIAQLKEMTGQYDKMKDTLAENLAPELQRISNLTTATFNAIIAQGGTMTEAFAAVKDPLDTLRSKYETLGITGGAAIQELLKLSEVEAANQGLFEALDGNRQVLEALGNTGFLTADAMKDTATQTQAYYDQLLGQGLNSKQALAMISPTLADMDYYAKQYGITLDDNTRMLIEQSKMAGTFKERGKDVVATLTDGFGDISNKLQRIIDQNDRDYSDRTGKTTKAASGFSGTVTGPRMFYVEPGVTENVQIGKPGQGGTTIVERPITMRPVVIPLKELKSIVIEWVQEESNGERLLIRPRSVRGGA